jgi:hypothetical protein
VASARQGFRCGVIEGFFGRPWSASARAGYADFLAQHGFDFYLYAPKADGFLRRAWREDWPVGERRALETLRARHREAGVEFGVGLTPYGLQTGYDAASRRALLEKVARIDALEPDLLAVLFDDVPGVRTDLAERQVAIAHDLIGASRARSFLFCPTYYSDDPIQASALGPMPERYLEHVGRLLDPGVAIFWTGPRICSREYAEAHLRDVAARLGRRPFLWDNYPVNDTPRLASHLLLRAVTGRPGALREWTSGLAANPMNQAELSKIPLLTLRESLTRGDAYDPNVAFREAARILCGAALAEALEADLPWLHDAGLGALDPARRAALRARYAGFGGPFAREVVEWLDGAYAPSAEHLAEFAGYDL